MSRGADPTETESRLAKGLMRVLGNILTKGTYDAMLITADPTVVAFGRQFKILIIEIMNEKKVHVEPFSPKIEIQVYHIF